MNRIDRKRKEMDIYFNTELVEDYQEDVNNIDINLLEGMGPEAMSKHGWIKKDKEERKIRRRGRFFQYGDDGFRCIVSNLDVYVGRFGKDNRAYIAAKYPFKKRIKKHMREEKKIIFEDD